MRTALTGHVRTVLRSFNGFLALWALLVDTLAKQIAELVFSSFKVLFTLEISTTNSLVTITGLYLAGEAAIFSAFSIGTDSDSKVFVRQKHSLNTCRTVL